MLSAFYTQPTHAITVELYYPTQDFTVTNFLITPSAAHQDIIDRIKRRFNGALEEVWPCDINGEPINQSEPSESLDGVNVDGDPVSNFGNVKTGERIILRASKTERVIPESRLETLLYSGDEFGRTVFKGMGGGKESRDHMQVLRRADAVRRNNIIRLTSSPRNMISELSIPRYDPVHALQVIDDAWKISR